MKKQTWKETDWRKGFMGYPHEIGPMKDKRCKDVISQILDLFWDTEKFIDYLPPF